MQTATHAQSLPLRELERDFVPVLELAVAQRESVTAFVTQALTDGVEAIIFVGTGGSLASSIHAVTTLKSRVTRLQLDNISSAEIVAALPKNISSRTLVIASSHSGGTPETVEATRLIKEAGATIITLSSETDTPLGRLADLALGYGSERTITAAKQILLSHITWAVLDHEGVAPELASIRSAYDALPVALHSALVESEERLARVARDITGIPFTYVLSSGGSYGAGYLLSMCYLIEMQWMRSATFNSGEFFHGAFEMVLPDSAVITLIGEDPQRGLGERAHRFAARYTPHAHALDTRELSLPGIPAELRSEITPIALGALAFRLADHLEAASGHSLDERRYMYKVEY